MLLAELHRKLRGRFVCGACGNDEASEFDTATEDALTSTVFGLMRYSDPDVALKPMLEYCGLFRAPDTVWQLRPWPRHPVRIWRIGDTVAHDISCEPDMIIEGPSGVVVMEAKCGAALGGDPMQLPQEALVAHTAAKGRPWRLLCVTLHQSVPWIGGFRASNGTIASGDPRPLGEAVASYFSALREVAAPGDWPDPQHVRENVRWMSWQLLATLIDGASANESAQQPHELALAHDVLRLLRARGLYVDPFRGFRAIPIRGLATRMPALWTPNNTGGPFQASYTSCRLVWPISSWLELPHSNSEQPRAFHSLAVRPMSWSLPAWLAPETRHPTDRRL